MNGSLQGIIDGLCRPGPMGYQERQQALKLKREVIGHEVHNVSLSGRSLFQKGSLYVYVSDFVC